MTTRAVPGARTAKARLLRLGAGRSADRLPVLMYHGIHAGPDFPGVFNAQYSVDVDDFRRQLDWLGAHGFHTHLLDDPVRSPRHVVLTFDDGDASATDVALPLLLERGMVAEFCITSDNVDQPGMVTRSGVRELARNGMGVQSHGRTHRPLSTLSRSELAEELTSSRQRLEEWSGRPVVAVSLPGGRGGAREFRAARDAGYRYLLNSVPGPNRRARTDVPLHRIPVTRALGLEAFGQLVRWRGTAPLHLTARTAALELPKRLLGDTRYDQVRAAVLAR